MATWTLEKIGAKFHGACIVCATSTDKQPIDMTPLYVVKTVVVQAKKTYGVAHVDCVGATLKTAIGGKQRIIGTVRQTVEIEAEDKQPPKPEQLAEIERLTAELQRTAMQRPAGLAPWKYPDNSAAALKIWDLTISDQAEAADAIKTLAEKVAVRQDKINAAQPTRKIDMD